MKINIYGVGRSGTKAVQLYFSKILAEIYGEVWVNYEPYFWKSRKGPKTYEGISIFENAPFFIDNNSYNNQTHDAYISKLLSNMESIPIVTKFIRANGHIRYINGIMKPDLSILVIRDLKNVLSSIVNQNWGLNSYSNNLFISTYDNNWNKFFNEIKDNKLFEDEMLEIKKYDYSKNKILCNAIYWFIMNKVAITNNNNSVILKYEDIDRGLKVELDKLLRNNNMNYRFDYLVSDFHSDDLHNDKHIKSIQLYKRHMTKMQLYNEFIFFINRLLSYSNKGIFKDKKIGILKDKKIGDRNIVVKQDKNRVYKKNELNISIDHPLIDYFQDKMNLILKEYENRS